MRLKIVSPDGSPQTTAVVNADTGELLDGVVAVAWSIEERERAKAIVTLVNVPVDVVADEVEWRAAVPPSPWQPQPDELCAVPPGASA